MGTPTTKTELLMQIRKELAKEYISYNVNSLPERKYTAPSYAVDGTPCFVVEYIYHPIEAIIIGRKEGYATWSSSFDSVDVLVDDLSNNLVDDLGNQLIGA